MADVYKGLRVEFKGDTKDLSAALREIKKEGSGVTTELKKIDRALKLDPGNIRMVNQQQAELRRGIQATEKELQVLKQAEEELSKTEGPYTPEQEAQWRKLQSDIAQTEQKLNSYKQALAKSMVEQELANSKLYGFAQGMEKVGGVMQSAGRKVESIGSTLTRTVTTGIVAAGTASVAAAVKIDTSLTNVKKTVDGTEQQYQQLKEAAIEFSKTNAVSADQILDIQALGAQLGFSIDELNEFSQVVSGLDIATNMDAETAATEMAHFANITKMSHDEISNYASAIVGLGNNFATTESDISSMAMRIAAAGTQCGLSQADILGLATALSSMGVEAEAGGTAISTIMSQIDKDVATNSESLQVWAETAGMSAEQFANAWKTNPVEALAQLLSHMEEATAEGGNMSVMLDELGISSLRQTDVMKRLAGNSELVGKAVAKANEEWQKNTALGAEVENRNNSLAAKFEMLKNRAIAIAESVGGPLADALLDAVEAAEPLIKAIADGAKKFSEMSKEEQQGILKTVAFVAALGPALTVLGKLSQVSGVTVSSLGKYIQKAMESSAQTKAFGKVGLEASTKLGVLGGAVGALAAAAAAFVVGAMISELTKLSDRAKDLDKATNGLKESMYAVNDSVIDAAGSLDSLSTEKPRKELSDLRKEVDENIKKQAELADSIAEQFGDINGSAAALDTYIGTIETLTQKYDESGNKCKLTADEQKTLEAAVAGVNKILGTSYTVIDKANGVLSVSTSELKSNAEAWIANAKAQAAQEKLVDLQKQQFENQERLTEAQKAYKEACANVQAAEEGRLAMSPQIVDAWIQAKDAMDEAQAACDANSEAQQRMVDVLNEAKEVLASTPEEFAQYINTLPELTAALQTTGGDVDAFAQKLSDLGFKTSDLGALTADQLQVLVENYQLSTSEIVALCDQMGIEVPEKARAAAQGATEAVAGEAPNTEAAATGTAEAVGAQFEGMSGEMTSAATEGAAGVTSAIANETGNAAAAAEGLVSSVDASTQIGPQMQSNGNENITQFTAGLQAGEPNAVAAADHASKQVADHFSSASTDAWFAGNNMTAESFAQGIDNGRSTAVTSAETTSSEVATAFNSANAEAIAAGEAMSAGMATGIVNGRSGVVEAAKETMRQAVAAAKAEAQIASPSKVMTRVGEFFDEGLALGIDRKAALAAQSTQTMVKGAISAASQVLGSSNLATQTARALSFGGFEFSSNGRATVRLDPTSSISKADIYDAVGAAVADAFRAQGDTILRVDDREVARAVRRYA